MIDDINLGESEELEEPDEPNELEEFKSSVQTLLRNFLVEDKGPRESHLQRWKRADYFWDGVQLGYWDPSILDYRQLNDSNYDSGTEDVEDDVLYIINIYRAYLESIIAALGQSIPKTTFLPKDADNPTDILTAKTYAAAVTHLEHFNKASKLLVKTIYHLVNQGIAFGYNYNEADKAYGVKEEPVTTVEPVDSSSYVCEACGHEESTLGNPDTCSECNIPFEASGTQPVITTEDVERIERYDVIPKTREIMEVYSPLYVRVPHYISSLKDSPYLILEFEQHYAVAREFYPDFYDKINPGSMDNERWARESTMYPNDNQNLVSIRKAWFKPAAYNILSREDAQELKAKFPTGVKVTFVNDLPVRMDGEALEDHWTATETPTSPQFHPVSVGEQLIPLQHIRNEVINLSLQTIEHGIPQTFVDNRLIDVQAYTAQPSKPGFIWPVRVPPGASLDSAVSQFRTATLSQEVSPFIERNDQDSQFVSGAFPSIFGGTQEGGSQTYKEYEKSAQQALQRLSLIYKVVKTFWSDFVGKATKSYITNLVDDEHITTKSGDDFVNIWVRKADSTGEVGEAIPEQSEELPVSWTERRNVLFNLFSLHIPEVNAAIFNATNIEMVASLIGLKDLKIPGQNDRNKQLMEIAVMLRQQPLGEGMSSIQPEEIDEPAIHIETCKDWLKSSYGQMIKESNPAAYSNVLFHLQAHEAMVQAQLAAQQQQQMAQGLPPQGQEGNPSNA